MSYTSSGAGNTAPLSLIIIGTGYVGLVAGVCFAGCGHRVTCIDSDSARIAALQRGECPIYEPGLPDALAAAVSGGLLSFASDYSPVAHGQDAIILAVGTPEDPVTGTADLRYLFAALEDIAAVAPAAQRLSLITKSTVPVGTAARLLECMATRRPDITTDTISNPEFLREGFALQDFTAPDRIICGCDSAEAADLCRRLYAPLTAQGRRLDMYGTRDAELVKYAANGFLAMKIAFINEMADMCEASGADIANVAHGIGTDSRIGEKFLQPGPGYGGSCFPKDTASLLKQTELAGAPSRLIEAAMRANALRGASLLRRLTALLPLPLHDARICILGAAFKANTDDVRESPALSFIRLLYNAGVSDIRVTDPQALANAEYALADIPASVVSYHPAPEDALADCNAAVIITEWPEFKALFPHVFLNISAAGACVYDTRNLLDAAAMRAASIPYQRIGEGTAP